MARVNQRKVYTLLFGTVADTLKSFGQKYLNGEIGFISTLHILRQAQDRLWGHFNPERCPMCGAGKMRPFEKLDAHLTRRKWQLAVH